METRTAKQAPAESVEVFEASGTFSVGRTYLTGAQWRPLKINTPEPPSEATVLLSAAFASKG